MTTTQTEVEPERLARRIAEIADSKKATDIVAIDMRGLVAYTDFLVICTAASDRQSKAIRDGVREELKKGEGLLPGRVEGDQGAAWVLVDYLDCILHVFTPEARDHYRLDRLWQDAPRLDLSSGVETQENLQNVQKGAKG